MRSRQIAERLGVEEAHMLEFQQFNALWDRRMAEFEQKSADLEEAMKERHGTELMEYIRNAQSEPLRLPSTLGPRLCPPKTTRGCPGRRGLVPCPPTVLRCVLYRTFLLLLQELHTTAQLMP